MKLTALAALALALGSMSPLAVLAAEPPATTVSANTDAIAPGTRFTLVDPQSGRVIGELIATGSKVDTIRAMAQHAPAAAAIAKPQERSSRAQEDAAFWEAFNQRVTGFSSP